MEQELPFFAVKLEPSDRRYQSGSMSRRASDIAHGPWVWHDLTVESTLRQPMTTTPGPKS